MADFNALHALINAYIKKNGVKAITGQILNGVLSGMVNALGKGFTVAGAATPETDPGTMTGPLAYIAYTAGTYPHFGGLVVEQGEVAMFMFNENEWTKDVLFSLAATASVDDTVGTPSVGVSFVDGLLTFDFHNLKGETGEPAGFGHVTATVDANIGTPSVTVQDSGPDTAKNYTFAFRNLKGETGVTSVVATVDNTIGTPSCAVSLNGQELHLDFHGLKGMQGDTGVSADYPIAIVNNLTTSDPASALSAQMGVQLESEVSQLEAEVDERTLVHTDTPSQVHDEIDGAYPKADFSGLAYGLSPRSTKRYAIETGKTYVIRCQNTARFVCQNSGGSSWGGGGDVTGGVDSVFTNSSGWAYLCVGQMSQSEADTPSVYVRTDTDSIDYFEARIDEVDGKTANLDKAYSGQIKSWDDVPDKVERYIAADGTSYPSQYRWQSDYLAVRPGDVVKYNNMNLNLGGATNYGIACYDANKAFLPGLGVSGSTSGISGTYTIPDGVAYIRISDYKGSTATFDIKTIGDVVESYNGIYFSVLDLINNGPSRLKGKKIAVFGDSIYVIAGNEAGKHLTIPHYLEALSGAEIHNFAIGGTGLTSIHSSGPYQYLDWPAIYAAIVSGDFTNQIAAAQSLGDPLVTSVINELQSFSFADFDIVLFGYGTNDFTAEVPLATISAAVKTAIQNVTTQKTGIRIAFDLLHYRMWNSPNDFVDDIFTHTNGIGLLAKDYSDAMQEAASELGVESNVNYNTLGWNQYNRLVYFVSTDGTHFRASACLQCAKRLFYFLNRQGW